MTERIPAEISMLSFFTDLSHLHDRQHTDRSNHGEYCLHACCTYMTKAYGGGSSSSSSSSSSAVAVAVAVAAVVVVVVVVVVLVVASSS